MEVQVRTVCNTCDGTAKNDIDDSEALQQAMAAPRTGVLLPGQVSPPSIEQNIVEIQRCKQCQGGYQYRWVDMAELKELINA